MAKMKLLILVSLFVVLVAIEAAFVQAASKGGSNGASGSQGSSGTQNQGNANNNKNKGNDNGNNNDSNEGDEDNNGGKGKGADDDETNYDELSPGESGEERHYYKAKGACYQKTLACPAQCPQKKPKNNKKHKGCHVDCSSKCEVTCKYRKPNCNGYGSLCYDPRFVGGDGVMFYFHGSKGGNFAIVSDDELQINAHFIGTRPQGRTRDFTWVQALAVMFDSHNLVIVAKRVSNWNDDVDSLTIRWDGDLINIPSDGDAEWKANSEERKVKVERTDDANSVKVKIAGLVEMNIKVRPIGKEENRVHNYQLPDNDAFAYLETQFKFKNLSDQVEGVLGKTYRPDYVSPVKIGVPMPMMGGEDKCQNPSLLSPLCKACRFLGQSGVTAM